MSSLVSALTQAHFCVRILTAQSLTQNFLLNMKLRQAQVESSDAKAKLAPSRDWLGPVELVVGEVVDGSGAVRNLKHINEKYRVSQKMHFQNAAGATVHWLHHHLPAPLVSGD